MENNMISIVIPSHNNLRHLKNAYASIKKHAPNAEIVLLDDASTDGTWEWIIGLDDENVIPYKSPTRDGHTVLYDLGIQLTTNDIVGIMHADMIMGQNYVENTIKHLKPKTVVCATRVEPPLHPAGPEKIVMDFGLDFDSLDIESFEKFVDDEQVAMNGVTSKSMFAPWVLYKEDFHEIGGHDWGFAPFPYEDSDIFQRWLLAGYELIQSRDALVYHLTCRGHRWTEEIGKNSDDFQKAEEKARKYYIKKWGSWIKNDEYQHPILTPVYNKKLILTNAHPQLEQALEPWFNDGEDIVVEIDGNKVTQDDFNYVMDLNAIIADNGEVGQFELGNLKITINKIEDKSKDLIFINNKL
jgi:glycosyltransferase involved in cell wall biosynthesis